MSKNTCHIINVVRNDTKVKFPKPVVKQKQGYCGQKYTSEHKYHTQQHVKKYMSHHATTQTS